MHTPAVAASGMTSRSSIASRAGGPLRSASSPASIVRPDERHLSSENTLDELRLTTRAEHARLERILRLAEPMPLERYGVILRGLDAFLRAWEPRIHAALPERLQGWFRSRRRGGFASADVEWLRAVEGIDPVPVAARLAAKLPLGDLAEVLGSLYVIESAAPGDRLIAPHLKRTLGLDQGRGASYFHGFGGETGVMWNNFRVLASLEIGESSRGTVRACKSAKRTFAALIDLFAPLAPATEAIAMRQEIPQQIAPALSIAFGDDDPESTRPMPLDDMHVDLEVDDEPAEGDTVLELPLEDLDEGGGDTVRMQL
jgi:heme oxygenase (biliverdin-IX-beta and delta-forming)